MARPWAGEREQGGLEARQIRAHGHRRRGLRPAGSVEHAAVQQPVQERAFIGRELHRVGELPRRPAARAQAAEELVEPRRQ